MNEILGTIEIRAKAERIFAPLTNPDLRVGGKWRMSGVGAGGRAINVIGEYRVIEPPRALEFTWLPDWHEGVGEPSDRV
ncbi:MAG: SRPBCC domain-containing protein [Bryobacteraceae bacterium]